MPIGVARHNIMARNVGLPAAATLAMDYLVVAGGGGPYRCAGGGAGGVLFGSVPVPAMGMEFTAEVGAGGAAATNGSDSVLSAPGFATQTAVGGGRSNSDADGSDGGSGGGGDATGIPDQLWSGGAGTPGQGHDGGSNAEINDAPFPAGGGGGAGEVGQDAQSESQGGKGGDGVSSSITGTPTYYGGGGGGGVYFSGSPSLGGQGGGGAGEEGGNSGENGTANTGGGGGGNGGIGSYVSQGGSGVIILSLSQAATSTTGSPSYSTSGDRHIYTFTGSGSLTI